MRRREAERVSEIEGDRNRKSECVGERERESEYGSERVCVRVCVH